MDSNRLIGQFVRRAFDFWHAGKKTVPPTARTSRTDHLVKMNLIPVFGRRDAAYDRVGELIHMELFSFPPAERQKIFLNIKRLLRRVESDTRKILTILSNPDTTSRETAFLDFVYLLDHGADALESFAVFSNHLISARSEVHDFSPLRTGAEKASSEEEIAATEIALVNQLRAFYDRVSPRVARYREYAGKSFSATLAERFKNSYNFYIRSFRGEDPTADLARELPADEKSTN